jgi:hypothetical protein
LNERPQGSGGVCESGSWNHSDSPVNTDDWYHETLRAGISSD